MMFLVWLHNNKAILYNNNDINNNDDIVVSEDAPAICPPNSDIWVLICQNVSHHFPERLALIDRVAPCQTLQKLGLKHS